MAKYDPKAIHRMAGLLTTVAFTLVGVAVFGAIIGSLVILSALSDLTGGVVAFLLAAVFAVVIIGAGYLIALVLRVVAQLMMAVVKIELNTSAGLSTQAATRVLEEVSRVSLAGTSDGAMHCPECGAEYVSGHTECSDCGRPLVAGPAVSQTGSTSGVPAAGALMPMICPGCGAEYRAGIVTCADCHVALVPAS